MSECVRKVLGTLKYYVVLAIIIIDLIIIYPLKSPDYYSPWSRPNTSLFWASASLSILV